MGEGKFVSSLVHYCGSSLVGVLGEKTEDGGRRSDGKRGEMRRSTSDARDEGPREWFNAEAQRTEKRMKAEG